MIKIEGSRERSRNKIRAAMADPKSAPSTTPKAEYTVKAPEFSSPVASRIVAVALCKQTADAVPMKTEREMEWELALNMLLMELEKTLSTELRTVKLPQSNRQIPAARLAIIEKVCKDSTKALARR